MPGFSKITKNHGNNHGNSGKLLLLTVAALWYNVREGSVPFPERDF